MKTGNTALVIINTITFILMLFANYASNAKLFADATIADIAYKYDTVFAPAGYAFIIWSLIFLLGFGFVIHQFTLLNNDTKNYIQRTGLWFTISNLANAFWVYCWVNEWLGWSVILILILLFSLIKLTINLRLELDNEPVRTLLFVWWPISIYLGWIMVATIACIASWLVSINWNGFGIAPAIWCIVMIIIAGVIYIWLNQKRNLREAASIGIWAFVAIAVRQWSEQAGIAITAVIVSAILTAITLLHGYKNRYYSPFAKIRRGEWK